MSSLDKIEKDLRLNFYEKDGNAFEDFVVSAYKLKYEDLIAVKPQGSKGDGSNDGYLSGKLILQVYAPERIEAKKAIEKMNHDFERVKKCGWNFDEWHYIVNDKFKSIARDIHHAKDRLQKNNPNIKIKLVDSSLLRDLILGELDSKRLRVYILINADKDISEFGDFEIVEKVIESISEEKKLRMIHQTEFMNFSKEEFNPNGIEKLQINIDENSSPEFFKFFGSRIEKSQEVMDEFIPQLGMDLFTAVGNYIQKEYKKYEEKYKPEKALLKTRESIYTKLDDDSNLETALWIIIAYFFDICDIGKIK